MLATWCSDFQGLPVSAPVRWALCTFARCGLSFGGALSEGLYPQPISIPTAENRQHDFPAVTILALASHSTNDLHSSPVVGRTSICFDLMWSANPGSGAMHPVSSHSILFESCHCRVHWIDHGKLRHLGSPAGHDRETATKEYCCTVG